MSRCPVVAAWDEGNAPDQDGDIRGFWLILQMKTGLVYRGDCYAPNDGVILMNAQIGTSDTKRPIHIRCSDVMTAEVEW